MCTHIYIYIYIEREREMSYSFVRRRLETRDTGTYPPPFDPLHTPGCVCDAQRHAHRAATLLKLFDLARKRSHDSAVQTRPRFVQPQSLRIPPRSSGRRFGSSPRIGRCPRPGCARQGHEAGAGRGTCCGYEGGARAPGCEGDAGASGEAAG